MVVMIETDKPDVREASEAHRLLLVHRPTSDGLCAGCLEFACTFARFPCPQATWAQGVRSAGAYGDRV
jgi:hypothetical protein